MDWRLLVRVGITVVIVLVLDSWFANAQVSNVDVCLEAAGCSNCVPPGSASTRVIPLRDVSQLWEDAWQ